MLVLKNKPGAFVCCTKRQCLAVSEERGWGAGRPQDMVGQAEMTDQYQMLTWIKAEGAGWRQHPQASEFKSWLYHLLLCRSWPPLTVSLNLSL